MVRGRQRLPRAERLTDSARIAYVRQHGRRYDGRWVRCFVEHNQLAINRVNVTVVSAPSSVVRHYFRRRLLEAYRTHKHLLATGLDIVIRIQVSSQDQLVRLEFRSDLLQLIGKINFKL